MKPLPTSRTRDAAGATDPGAGRSVSSAKSIESPSEKDVAADREHGQGRQHRLERM